MQMMSERSPEAASILSREDRTWHAQCFTYICIIKSSQHCGLCYRRCGEDHEGQPLRVHGHRKVLTWILKILYSGREAWRQSGTPWNKHATLPSPLSPGYPISNGQ